MWHYANYQGKELLIIGHSTTRNDCIVVDLAAMPMNEATDLRRIAQSRSGQEQERLVPLLQSVVAPDRVQDWFSYLMYKSKQRNGPVFNLPLKEVQDSLEEDQRAIFKGYGKGRRNKYLDMMTEAAANGGADATELSDDLIKPVNTATVNGRPEFIGNHSTAGWSSPKVQPTHELGDKLDVLLDETRKTQQLLNKLIGALTETTDEPEPEVAAPKTTSKRPSRARTKESGERAQA